MRVATIGYCIHKTYTLYDEFPSDEIHFEKSYFHIGSLRDVFETFDKHRIYKLEIELLRSSTRANVVRDGYSISQPGRVRRRMKSKFLERRTSSRAMRTSCASLRCTSAETLKLSASKETMSALRVSQMYRRYPLNSRVKRENT